MLLELPFCFLLGPVPSWLKPISYDADQTTVTRITSQHSQQSAVQHQRRTPRGSSCTPLYGKTKGDHCCCCAAAFAAFAVWPLLFYCFLLGTLFELAEPDFLQRVPNQHITNPNTANKQRYSTSAEQHQEGPAVRRCTGRLGVTAAAAFATAIAAFAAVLLLLLLCCFF